MHVLSLVRALHLLHLFLCSVLWAMLVVRCTLHVVCVACCHYNVHTQMEVEDHRMADLKAFLPQCIKSRLDAQQVSSHIIQWSSSAMPLRHSCLCAPSAIPAFMPCGIDVICRFASPQGLCGNAVTGRVDGRDPHHIVRLRQPGHQAGQAGSAGAGPPRSARPRALGTGACARRAQSVRGHAEQVPDGRQGLNADRHVP